MSYFCRQFQIVFQIGFEFVYFISNPFLYDKFTHAYRAICRIFGCRPLTRNDGNTGIEAELLLKFFNLRGNLFYDDSISGHIISLMLTFGKSNVFSPLISSFYKTRIFEKKQAGYE